MRRFATLLLAAAPSAAAASEAPPQSCVCDVLRGERARATVLTVGDAPSYRQRRIELRVESPLSDGGLAAGQTIGGLFLDRPPCGYHTCADEPLDLRPGDDVFVMIEPWQPHWGCAAGRTCAPWLDGTLVVTRWSDPLDLGAFGGDPVSLPLDRIDLLGAPDSDRCLAEYPRVAPRDPCGEGCNAADGRRAPWEAALLVVGTLAVRRRRRA